MEPAILAVTSLVGALVLALWRHMDGRFKQVDERLDRLEAKLSGQGERIARVEGVQSVVVASGPAANPGGATPPGA